MSYNEPVHMQKALLEKGIPVERIYLDYAGFRTQDSIVRCKEVFGQNKVTVTPRSFTLKGPSLSPVITAYRPSRISPGMLRQGGE
ncbi:MAG: hypothetical protein SVR04_14430 [Spirochaetota bacterium]|nr:hypothetical protein [Spirochaetota bacterium]